MKKILIALFVVMSSSVFAGDCVEITKCIEQVSKLSGKKYIYDAKEIKGGVQETSNSQMTAENADTLFTYMLYLNGYARVPTIEKDTYMIINAHDIRYQAFPIINVDSKTAPTVLPNFDYYMMNFKFNHYDHRQMRDAANALRPFMSRYGRTVELTGTGTLAIQENASILARAYEIVKKFDRELTKEEIKKSEQIEAEEREERKEERKERMKEGSREEKKGEHKTDRKY
jgi:type II secretory pathway component GspD/PulD (secretin)